MREIQWCKCHCHGCFPSGDMPSRRHHIPGNLLVVIGVNMIVNLEPTILLIFSSNIVTLYIELKLSMNGIQECKQNCHRCFHSGVIASQSLL